MSGELIAYFGYGSLVNSSTLAPGYVETHSARLKGWRRHWQSRGHSRSGAGQLASANTPSIEQFAWQQAIRKAGYNGSVTPQDLALLSVHRDEQSSISGLLIIDRLENLPALDERERLYDRVRVPVNDLQLAGPETVVSAIAPQNIFIYVGQAAPAGLPPLLQSYLDTVMLGFLETHGDAGLEDFLTSTIGFAREIIRDRDAPIYPRAVKPGNRLAERFDALLLSAGVRY